MAYFEQNGEHYNEEIRKIEITDPAHADLINDLIQLLVNNDAFIKKYIDNHLNVDNTADIDKPVSTAQATAIADAKKAGTDAQTNINNHTSNINNPHNVTKTQVGLSDVDNTADINKPVSVAQQDAIDAAYANSNYYTDQRIAELINGAPTTLDTLKEIADAMAEQESVVEALDEAIGSKANENEFNSHVTNKNNPHGVTASQIGALATNGDSKLNTVTFTTKDVDDASATSWTSVSKLTSGITHKTFFERVSQMFKNVRYLYKMLGTTDISEIGDGTVTGGLSTLNSNLSKLNNVSGEGDTLLRCKDIALSEETFSASAIGTRAIPTMEGYKIISVSPWVKGDWSDAYALVNYHGYLGECSVSCKNLDANDAHKWIYGAVVLYAKIL